MPPDFPSSRLDDLVKNLKLPISVIPAKAGIQFFPARTNSRDSGFRRSDDFLQDHQIWWICKSLQMSDGKNLEARRAFQGFIKSERSSRSGLFIGPAQVVIGKITLPAAIVG